MAEHEMKTLTFFELLNNENNGIVIPRIQRDYAQGRSNESAIRSDFLDAIHKTIEEKDCKLSLDFVYGSVSDKTDEENSGKFIPLDGQQRLTTLFLLHIYASWHKGNFREEKETFSRFTYRTRETATDFIAKLVSLETAPSCNVAPSFWFRDQNWFPYSWDEDPTVVSMLVMLDAIAAKFADVATILWDRLVDDKAIFFHFLDIKELGMTDDIYIKMNSRGLPLTEFEKVKVSIKQKLNRIFGKTSEYTVSFMTKIDGVWTDALWCYHDIENQIVDNFFVNLLHYVLDMCRMEEYADFIPDAKETLFQAIRDGITTAESVYRLETMTDTILSFARKDGISYFEKFISEDRQKNTVSFFDDEHDYLKRCVFKTDFSYVAELILYAFIIKEDNQIPDDIFAVRLRHLRNIVMNSADYLRSENMAYLIRDVKTLISGGIDSVSSEKARFRNSRQILEEKQKEDLVRKDPEVLEDLYSLEDTYILQGSIAIVGVDNKSYFHNASHLLALSKDSPMLLLRAMLSVDDYHQEYNGWRWQFGSGRIEKLRELFHVSERISLFEKTRSVFLSLLDKLGDDISLQSLQKASEIQELPVKDYRYYMIKYPVIMDRSDYGRFYLHGKSPYSIVIMSTESRASDNSWSAILFASVYENKWFDVIPQLKEKDINFKVDYHSLFFTDPRNDRTYRIECDPENCFQYILQIGENADCPIEIDNDGTYDLEDRVIVIRRKIEDLLS